MPQRDHFDILRITGEMVVNVLLDERKKDPSHLR